ncbi:MAG: NERD domain-containing protein [Frankiaceae bacterium]|nr:NERD domain-containing protein [Frankiaceae bacterium]
MAAESGVERARHFRDLADEHQSKAEMYRARAVACEKGVFGEAEVARLLDVLDGAGWRVLNDRYKAAGSPVNIDHIVVGPPGVLVVDAKNWSGGPVRLDAQGMSHRGRRRDKELTSLRDAVQAVDAHVRRAHSSAVTVGALAFVGEGWSGEPVFHDGVVVMRADSLQRWLTSLPGNLTPQQVNLVASTLDAALPPRTGSARPLTLAGLRGATRPRSAPPAAKRNRVQRRQVPRPRQRQRLRGVLVKGALAVFFFLVILPSVITSAVSDLVERIAPLPVVSPAPAVVPAEPSGP